MRLIDADEFIATHGMPLTMSQFYGNTAELKSFNEGIRFVVECMKGLPVHDPVRHGHWIEDDGCQICSNCGEEHEWGEYRANYCEACGAKMDEVSE